MRIRKAIASVAGAAVMGLWTLLVAGGCASRAAESKAAIEPIEPDQKLARPFMINEASLPAGFPPPGPVGEVVLKRYPASRAAVAQAAPRADGGGDENAMFSSLFKHISRNDIAMTAPVVMGYDAPIPTPGEPASDTAEMKPDSMAFFYGDASLGQTGRSAAAEGVEVVDLPAVTVLSVGVRGSYDGEGMSKGLALLREHLTKHADRYEAAGPPRILGYNSPFVPWFWRFGEVQLPVKERP